jgi:3-deoxy-manno-octulosonate cytidylyltransferase (CMP-KDO synthetase)
MEEVYIIIPARIGSTRLPNKPLIDLNGRSLIQRVYLNASKISSNVFVATDSKKIEQNLSDYTSNIIMTSSDHISGTDRIFEAAQKLNIKDDSLIINLQGDEPFLPIDAISQIIQTYQSIEPDVITLSCSLDDVNDLNNPNCVKVKTNIDNYALDFFRISDEENLNRHIGIYGYSFKTLKKLINLDPSDREIEYKLEQLRFLDNNFSIYVSYYDRNISHGIDTDLDVINARKILNN